MTHQINHPHPLTAIKGRVLKILLIIVAVIILIIAAIFYFTNTITTVPREQLAYMKAGQIEQAYNLTSKEFRKVTTIDDFKTFVEQYPIVSNYKSIHFTERKIEGDTGYLSGTIEDADGNKKKLEYQLVKEDNVWRIQAMRLSELDKQASEDKPQSNQ